MVGGLEQRREAMPEPERGTTRRASSPFHPWPSYRWVVPALSLIVCEACRLSEEGGKAESELRAIVRTESGLRAVARTAAPDPRRFACCRRTSSKKRTDRSCRRSQVPRQITRPEPVAVAPAAAS